LQFRFADSVFWSGVCGFHRSPTMRAERAKLKSLRDDMTIAPGKRSAARGYGRKMISSFFPSGLAPLWRAKPEGKKRGWGSGPLPRAAASAALPGAIIMPPLRGRNGEPDASSIRSREPLHFRDPARAHNPRFAGSRAAAAVDYFRH
jgi:hypothetical protein